MVRHTLLSLAAAGLLSAAAAVPAEAHGSHRHSQSSIDAGFRVGGLYFNVVKVRDRYRPDGFYLKVSKPLYGETACSGFCYRDRGHSYHHRSCPAVVTHFEHYRPGLFFAMFGAPVWKDRHYRDDRHYGRHDRHVSYRHEGSHGGGYYRDSHDEWSDEWNDAPRRHKGKRYGVRRY